MGGGGCEIGGRAGWRVVPMDDGRDLAARALHELAQHVVDLVDLLSV
jgi:hypothetical protein